MLALDGKTAVVTGAGSSIGRGIALALAGAGADVLCADIVPERAEATARVVRDLGRRATACAADVRRKPDLVAMSERASREHGALDICVANAGIGRIGTVLTMAEADWDAVVDVNLKGAFLTVQACAREMVKHDRGGRIIAIASLAAERPAPALFAYCATKAGVRMMARCWAQELAAFGITVNSIGPGIIDTPLAAGLIGEGDQRLTTERAVPVGRLGSAEDIGRLACWLASDEAAYVTGTFNLVDGGLGDRTGLGLDSAHGREQQMLRDARGTMSGEALLALIDQAVGQRVEELHRQRAARGLQ